jgi:hypothetical protein
MAQTLVMLSVLYGVPQMPINSCRNTQVNVHLGIKINLAESKQFETIRARLSRDLPGGMSGVNSGKTEGH